MKIGLRSNLPKDNLSIRAQKSKETIAEDIEPDWKQSIFTKVLKIKLKRLEPDKVLNKNYKSIEDLEIQASKDDADKKEKNKNLQIVEISDDESIREDEASSTSKLQKCSICKFSVKNIDRHNMSFHKSTNLIFCQYCPKVFVRIEGLLLHEKNYHTHQNTDTNNTKCGTDTENMQVIELSDDEFAEDVLNIEQINKHKKCSICKISIKNMEAHNKKFHKNTKLIFCEVCSEAFINIRGLLKHEKILHPLVKTCLECKDTAETEHLKQLRVLLKPLYPCEICSKFFNQHRLLEMHFMIHQRMCHTCGKLYSLKYSQSFDLQINREFCHLCGKCYRTERKLTFHSCQGITLLCFQCGKSCNGESELNDHNCHEASFQELTKNVDEAVLIDPEPYDKQENGTKDWFEENYKGPTESDIIDSSSSLCFTCGRVFDQKDQLKNHVCSVENTDMKDKSSEKSSCQDKNINNSKQDFSSNTIDVPCLRCGKVFKENKLNHNCQVDNFKENESIELVDLEKSIVETVILKDNENDNNLNKISEKENNSNIGKYMLQTEFENNQFQKPEYLSVELMEVDDNLIAFVADEENGVVDIDFYQEVDLPQKIPTNKREKKKYKTKKKPANDNYSVIMFNDNGELNSSCNTSSFQKSNRGKNKIRKISKKK